MKKISLTGFVAVLSMLVVLTGCSKNKVKPVSERIAKVWSAQQVKQDNVIVYTKGGASNVVPGYSQYTLDLSNPPTVVITQVDGFKSTGQYSVPTDNQLVLSNLSPAPTDGATITYTIGSVGDNQLVITRTTADRKTGGTSNEYTLSNP